ncbi:MAG: hypothetical protein DRZ82_00980 [Thermoprotei archaeon]|nr:MAG: hypothetical protein DRZ82_00980 [Thermoprotei archaeon]
MFEVALLASILSGGLCGILGYYVQRFNIVTLSFSVAHAALAGAALALVLGLDVTYLALVFASSFALVIGIISTRVSTLERELISMGFFSLFNAIALLMIYMSTTYVLSTASISVVLWGSLLAITKPKVITLLGLVVIFSFYIFMFRSQIDAILFDRKLAEAEGIDVDFHILITLLFVGTAIAFTLRLTGGFLVFTLLYNPVASTMQLIRSAQRQQLMSPILGAISAMSGLVFSYILDWPVGATIALISSIILISSYIARIVINFRLVRIASREDSS